MGILVAILVLLVCSLSVEYLWNYCLITAIDGVHPITYWQSVGLVIMCNVLFKPTSVSLRK